MLNFWERFPYFLPIIPTVLVTLVCTPLLLFAFPETLSTSAAKSAPPTTDKEATSPTDKEAEPFVSSTSDVGDQSTKGCEGDERAAPFRCCRRFCRAHPGLPSVCKMLSIPDVVLCLGNYSNILFVAVAYSDLVGLWTAATPQAGGLGWSTNITGILLAIVGVCSTIWSLILYPKTVGKWPIQLQIRFSQLVLVLLLIFYPFTNSFQSDKGGFGDWRLWLPLSVLAVSVRVCIGTTFTAANMLTNNSVSLDKRVRFCECDLCNLCVCTLTTRSHHKSCTPHATCHSIFTSCLMSLFVPGWLTCSCLCSLCKQTRISVYVYIRLRPV